MVGKLATLLLAAMLLAGCGSDASKVAGSKAGAVGKEDSASPGDNQVTARAPGAKSEKGPADQADAAGKEDKRSVELTPDERTRLGISTTPAQAITFTPSATAFAIVLSHESIAQAVADLETAEGAARLSQTALARVQKLAGGPGALGVDALETLEKQSSADRAALLLAQRKLTVVMGVGFPHAAARATLDALASGQSKLVRATFPLGALSGEPPKTLRLVPLDPGAGTTSWTASPVWEAPQDATLPGRSYFALIEKSDVPEGLRLQALAGAGAAQNGIAGVLIPATAVIVSNGQYWCYLEKNPGTFTRVAIDINKPLGQGYFISDGIADGDQVVTSSAGLLLARETNASTEPDDG